MNHASSEAARRQIIEFDELVSRFERINERRSNNSAISLDSGLNYYNCENSISNEQNAYAGNCSTLSLDRPHQPQQQLSNLTVLEDLARFSRSGESGTYIDFFDQNNSSGGGNGSGDELVVVNARQLRQPQKDFQLVLPTQKEV